MWKKQSDYRNVEMKIEHSREKLSEIHGHRLYKDSYALELCQN